MSDLNNTLPPEFDYKIYVNSPENSDISCFDEKTAVSHYSSFGQAEGRVCNQIKSRMDFVKFIPVRQPLLEIGPFFSPSFVKAEANVYYLDCLSREEMGLRAKHVNDAAIESIPEIDYVWSGQSYAELIKRKFSNVYSAHNIEHQPCLITHIKNIESVLNVDGLVFFTVPDKRYCFDHFLAETTLADVVDAWKMGVRRHRLKDVLEHQFFPAHNDPVRHWKGDHGHNRPGSPLEGGLQHQFLEQVNKYYNETEYIDVHAWKFSPPSFRTLFNDLYDLNIIDLQILRLYPTIKNSNEFYVVLNRGRK